MGRHRGKYNNVDRNHSEIVAAFIAFGCSVFDLAKVGKGCPDILVGFQGVDYLVEIKDGDKTLSAKALTPDQRVVFGLPVRDMSKVSQGVTAWLGRAPYLVETTYDVTKLVERWRQKDTTDNAAPRLCVGCRKVSE